MAAEDSARTLVVEHPGLYAGYDAASKVWEQLQNTYETIGIGIFLHESTIDLTGYAMDHKTFVPYSSFEQVGGFFQAQIPGALTSQPYLQDLTLISSVPLSRNDLIAGTDLHPGFLSTGGLNRVNRDVIIHGDCRSYTVNSTMAVPTTMANLILDARNTFSSLEPTAADTLFCYRVIRMVSQGENQTAIIAPVKRVLLPGTITKEPQLEYMMRLKRSYELANQV
jgi:hypothetical protein